VEHDKLSFPFTEEKIRALKVDDEMLISGVGFAKGEIDAGNVPAQASS